MLRHAIGQKLPFSSRLMFSERSLVGIDSHEWTSILSKLIFHFGSGFCFTTKNTVHNWCGKARNVFSESIRMRQAAYCFRSDYDLHASTSNTLFVVSDKILPFVEKIYRRHNNLMTGVVWRTWRSNITSRIFCVFWKRLFWGGISIFHRSRIGIYFP